MKKLIILCAVNAELQGKGERFHHIPLGLLYVGTALKRSGYKVIINNLSDIEFNDSVSGMCKADPLWIGFSVLSGYTTFLAAKWSKRIKSMSKNINIVWGGHHPSAVPRDVLKEDYVDFVVVGEGEYVSVDLSRALEKSEDFSLIKGLGYKKEGFVFLNEYRAQEVNLDEFNLDWSLIDLNQYKHKNRHGKIPISLSSSRGCPYNCSFCATNRYVGKKWRTHSGEYIIRQIKELNKHGFNSVFFTDDNFMIDKNRALSIIEGLRLNGVSTDTLDIRLNQIDSDLLLELKKMNATGIFFGYESGSDRLLKLMNKGFSLEFAREKISLISKYNITCWASGIIGVPTETKMDLVETIKFTMWLRDILPSDSVVSMYRYMPLPNTDLMTTALQEGFIYPKNTEEWKKIDPLYSDYRLSEWIKYLDEEGEDFYAFLQESSRRKMFNYLEENRIACVVNNYFVNRMRDAALSGKLNKNNKLAFSLFGFLRDLYSMARHGKIYGIKSNVFKNKKND